MSKLRFWLGLGLLALLISGCSQSSTATPEITPQEATPQAVAPTATVVAAVNYCVDCHTDKDLLIQTAKPEEVKESESEGVG